MSHPLPQEKLAPIKAALASHQKIEAIKLYREATGLGLAEAKDAVERLEAELGGAAPSPAKPKEKRGCLGLLLGIVVVAGAVLYWTLG